MNPINYICLIWVEKNFSPYRRVYSFLSLLLLLLLTTGCMKEDYSWCPENKHETVLELLFEYTNSGGNNKFKEELHRIDIVLFDENHTLYQQVRLNQTDLDTTNSASLNVEPGTYYVVGWGNIANNSLMAELSSVNIFERSVILHQTTTSIDSLYYAPDLRGTERFTIDPEDEYFHYKVVVAPNDMTYHTLPFMTAFHTINVFIKGLKDMENPDIIYPEVQINNLPSRYNYLLEYPEEEKNNFKNKSRLVYYEQQPLLFATSLIPHFKNENDIFIRVVRNIDGQEKIDNLNLTEFLAKEKISIQDGASQVINIEFEYGGNDHLIGITLPDWIGQSVNPSFE
ncbi:MAG: FimB/Mfa2 family fimbrial subunit [Tannerellaceae bacterium]|nr:FimB/Mfa2 family fimbrial subunit [Tannerellaceae bacterium]